MSERTNCDLQAIFNICCTVNIIFSLYCQSIYFLIRLIRENFCGLEMLIVQLLLNVRKRYWPHFIRGHRRKWTLSVYIFLLDPFHNFWVIPTVGEKNTKNVCWISWLWSIRSLPTYSWQVSRETVSSFNVKVKIYFFWSEKK